MPFAHRRQGTADSEQGRSDLARSDATNSPTTAVQPRGTPQERAPTEPSAGEPEEGLGIPKVRIKHIARPLASVDNPRLCSQVKSGRCQHGSRIVPAAFAGLRARLTFVSR